MLTWLNLVNLPEPELACQDIAATNLVCAVGLPSTDNLDISACLETVDRMARRVKWQTDRHAYRFARKPEDYEHSWADFRMLWLANILPQDFAVGYNHATRGLSDRDFFRKPEHVFLHGAVKPNSGSCSSLPVLYAAVGRRLGYPLKLALARSHVYLRWEDPEAGEQFNIECTGPAFGKPPDQFYTQGVHEVSAQEIRARGLLRSLNPRRELAVFLRNRAHCLLDKEQFGPGIEADVCAASVVPEDEVILNNLKVNFNKWHDHLGLSLPPNFPEVEVRLKARAFPKLPIELEQRIITMSLIDAMIHTNREPHRSWWEALRRSPNNRPVGVPTRLTIDEPDRMWQWHMTSRTH